MARAKVNSEKVGKTRASKVQKKVVNENSPQPKRGRPAKESGEVKKKEIKPSKGQYEVLNVCFFPVTVKSGEKILRLIHFFRFQVSQHHQKKQQLIHRPRKWSHKLSLC